MSKKFNFGLFLCLLPLFFSANAQAVKQKDFAREAVVETVPEKGFYRILLSPQVVGYLQHDFSDIRIYNEQNQEVPYLWQTAKTTTTRSRFIEYKILENSSRTGCCSELVLHNPHRRQINNISLLIANADAVKPISLSGSNDRQNWYVVKERDVIRAVQSNNATAELKLLNFPLSDYEYFRLLIADTASAPLNILKAGYYETETNSGAGNYTPIPDPVVTRKDSARTTYLTLKFDQPYYLDRLQLDISKPGYYYRTGTIFVREQNVPQPEEKRRRRKRRKSNPQQVRSHRLVQQFLLRSDAPAVIELPRQAYQEIQLRIENADSPPLEIDDVEALQINHYLLAHLQPKESYTVMFDNPKVPAPDYDLRYFSDSIPENLPVVNVGEIKSLKSARGEARADSKLPKSVIWLALLVVGALLAYVTIKLVNDMKKKSS